MFKHSSLLKITAIFLSFIFMLSNQILSAKTMPEEHIHLPLLVLDETIGAKIPSHFRRCNDAFGPTANPLPSREGLDDLKAAGSAQFSKASLDAALKSLSGPVWIIDLRQESHGFVNGIPISWYSDGNQSNIGESDDNIQRQEEMLFNDLKHQAGIIVNKILEKKEGVIIRTRPVDLKVSTVATEVSLIDHLNLGYLRLGVLDHHRPNDSTVDQFIDFIGTLPPEAWVYFHCRGGKGRTTTFMVMYDILHNADKVSLDDIVNRQALIGGSNLFTISEEEDDAWKKQAAQERKTFIAKFYEYVKDHKGYPKHATWSEWAKKHGALSTVNQ